MDNKKIDDVEAHGFNDDELANIMSEIEDLENDLSSPEVDDGVDEVNNETKDVLLKLADMPQEKSIKTAPTKNYESHKSSTSPESKMEFSVSGNMVVNLTFHVGGESVCLTVNESEGLVIEMNGGAKFCLPIKADSQGKKVA